MVKRINAKAYERYPVDMYADVWSVRTVRLFDGSYTVRLLKGRHTKFSRKIPAGLDACDALKLVDKAQRDFAHYTTSHGIKLENLNHG